MPVHHGPMVLSGDRPPAALLPALRPWPWALERWAFGRGAGPALRPRSGLPAHPAAASLLGGRRGGRLHLRACSPAGLAISLDERTTPPSWIALLDVFCRRRAGPERGRPCLAEAGKCAATAAGHSLEWPPALADMPLRQRPWLKTGSFPSLTAANRAAALLQRARSLKTSRWCTA